jgi:hypothetical protein
VRPPRAQYAWNGDVAIAYGVIGDGPIDLVYIQGVRLRRGDDVGVSGGCGLHGAALQLVTTDHDRSPQCGMSDRFSRHDLPPLEDAARDVLCVLEAVGSKKARCSVTMKAGSSARCSRRPFPNLHYRTVVRGRFLFPINALPTFLMWFAKFLPLTYALAIMRYGLLSDSSGLHDIWKMSNATTMASLSLVVVAVFAAALSANSVRVFARAALH